MTGSRRGAMLVAPSLGRVRGPVGRADGTGVVCEVTDRLIVIDDDQAVRHLVEEVLTGRGYAVSSLDDLRSASIRATVIALEPDRILLDSAGRAEYEASWIEAA